MHAQLLAAVHLRFLPANEDGDGNSNNNDGTNVDGGGGASTSDTVRNAADAGNPK